MNGMQIETGEKLVEECSRGGMEGNVLGEGLGEAVKRLWSGEIRRKSDVGGCVMDPAGRLNAGPEKARKHLSSFLHHSHF